MSSIKRKALDTVLQRRVRARRESSEELEESPQLELSGSDNEGEENGTEASDQEDDNESSSSDEEEPTPENAASISFGALAKAEATLSGSGKRTKRSAEDDTVQKWGDNEAQERKEGRKDRRDFNRSSKHAPTEISSKKAVSRKRDVVPVPKREFRDPRFDTISGMVDDDKIRKAYSFLDDYREDEMKELKTAIKNSKDEDKKEELKRVLLSMESRKKAQLRKDKAKEVLDKHRKEEKEAVRMGKKPFYLKESEQKKRALVEQFGGLKGKQLDRVIERRRKKVEGKEKKNMPFARRTQE
ncbi:DUF947-domain-containing protein [Venustampulla echinocandica]|uniref:rRNA biogenesis protein RRP36 n=1 Tax=Venustampulla echinocandica TaxID=2656787 RepID=A0A370TIF5_9HELO|nr:DUF947-domain-containing protein [Venustampulla echinocandica]RDL35125.1 DUF947-domain-containing protein [Venustampulla echinocandica]